MHRQSRQSLTAVVWTLAAAAADFDNAVSPDPLAPVLAREAGVGGPGLAIAHRVAA